MAMLYGNVHHYIRCQLVACFVHWRINARHFQRKSMLHHASFVWYFVLSLRGLASWIVVVTGLAALISFTSVALIFAGVTQAIQYSYVAFTEARSNSPVGTCYGQTFKIQPR